MCEIDGLSDASNCGAPLHFFVVSPNGYNLVLGIVSSFGKRVLEAERAVHRRVLRYQVAFRSYAVFARLYCKKTGNCARCASRSLLRAKFCAKLRISV